MVQALCQQIGARVYGGVTCLVELTDTDYSWSFKAGVNHAQVDMRKNMKVAAAVHGEAPTFKCGPAEMVKIIVKAQQAGKA